MALVGLGTALGISALALGGSAAIAYLGGTIAQNVAKYFLFYDEFESEKIDRSQLRMGDHIFVPGSKLHGLKVKGLVGYYHHGVYLGVINGKEMITDFGAANPTIPVIRELDEFLGDYSNQLYRRNYKVPSTLLSTEKTLQLAKSICSGKHPWPHYKLNTNNCEHYATLLKMAQVHSSQATHLPQDLFYRQIIAPHLGASILKQHSDDN